MTSDLKIKTLNPSNIPDGSVCVFIGKRKTGKSCAIRDLMYHKRYYPMGMIISGSEFVNPFFCDFFPDKYIMESYDDDAIKNVIKRQKKIKKYAEQQKKLGKREVDSRFFLVFDDCLHDANKWKKAEPIKSIFMNGRHFGLFFLLSFQYVIGIPPNLRTNIDYVFIFRDSSRSNRYKLWKEFGAAIHEFKLFCAIMDNLDEFECIVICLDATKTKFEDQIMYWKATLRQNFRFGSQEFWTHNIKLNQYQQKLTEACYQVPAAGTQKSKRAIKIFKEQHPKK